MNYATPASRARGIVLMLGAGVCWSTGGIIVRSLTLTDTWTIVFWRACFMALFLGAVLFALHGRAAAARVCAIGAGRRCADRGGAGGECGGWVAAGVDLNSLISENYLDGNSPLPDAGGP